MIERLKNFFRRYRGLSGNVLALSLVSLFNDTSSEIIYPLLPAFLALTLGASPFAIGLIEGFAESVAAFLKLFSGYLSDKFHSRKLPVFVGYSLAGVVRPLLAFATSWPQVLFVRLTDRVGKGIRGAPRDALIAGSVPPERRGVAFGFNRAADHLGAVFGPICASLLLYLLADNPNQPTARDYSHVFLFASAPVVIGLFVIAFFVKEEPRPVDIGTNNKIRLSLGEFDSNFKRFLVVIAIFTLSNSTDAFLLLRAEQSGVPIAALPLLWMSLHFSKVIFSLIGGDLSDKIGRRTMIVVGWIVYAAVYGGFAFASEAWHAWTLFILYGAYFGLTEGVEKAFVADLVEDAERRGTAYGFYNLAISVTVFPASLLFGAMWTWLGAQTAFLVSAAVSIAAVTMLLTVRGSR